MANNNCEERRLFVLKFNKEAPNRKSVSYWKRKMLEIERIVTDPSVDTDLGKVDR